MKTPIRQTLLAAFVALIVAAPAFAQIQSPSTDTQFTLEGLTREGTEITNLATATYTDENGNTYAPEEAQATVTVGFLADLRISAPATQAPDGPSQDNELLVTVTNKGNGDDYFELDANFPAGITNIRYDVDGSEYTDLASLNAALAAMAIEADHSLVIKILYDVEDGYGGVPLQVDLTVTSTKDPNQDGSSDSATTIITPELNLEVSVISLVENVDRLPSNGTEYTAVFTVYNYSNIAETFNLEAFLEPGSVLSVVSVNGVPGGTTDILIPASSDVMITVVYTVADDALAGASNSITLAATSQADPTVTDDAVHTVTVIRPALSMTKTAYRYGRVDPIGTGLVLPGEFIEYRIEVTNNGSADATDVEIIDALPAELVFVSFELDLPGDWTAGESSGTVTAELNGPLAPSGSRFIWIRAQVK
jgi:uncharacterized repeat protein (TIGR01451 family)